MTLRSFLYRVARRMGDVRAVRRGPMGIVKRLVNKQIGRRIVRRLYLK